MGDSSDPSSFNFNNSRNERPYGNSIVLNEIHNLFPAFLYDNTQFQSVDDVFNYVDSQMNERFNIFNANRNSYRQRNPRNTNSRSGRWRRNRQARYQDDIYRTPTSNVYVEQPQQPPYYRGASEPVGPVNPPAGVPVGPRGPRGEFTSSHPLSFTGPTGTISDRLMISRYLTPTRANDDILANILAAAIINPTFSEPVLVIPTAEHLANATTTLSALMDLESPCAVCQDTMNVGQQVRRLNSCTHTFHTQCIDTWFQRNVHCPVCRHDIRSV